jgi:hypothetical protein
MCRAWQASRSGQLGSAAERGCGKGRQHSWAMPTRGLQMWSDRAAIPAPPHLGLGAATPSKRGACIAVLPGARSSPCMARQPRRASGAVDGAPPGAQGRQQDHPPGTRSAPIRHLPSTGRDEALPRRLAGEGLGTMARRRRGRMHANSSISLIVGAHPCRRPSPAQIVQGCAQLRSWRAVSLDPRSSAPLPAPPAPPSAATCR